MSAGETAHVTGHEGVYLAKDWLEKTGRVKAAWTVYEQPEQLKVPIPSALERSFDLGGLIDGGDLNGHEFYAEIKHVNSVGSQPNQYSEYLANCYCMVAHDPGRLRQFFWVTWHPFSQTDWTNLTSVEMVSREVERHKSEWHNTGFTVDQEICTKVSHSLWIIVLSKKQESLVMSDEMYAEVMKQLTLGRAR